MRKYQKTNLMFGKIVVKKYTKKEYNLLATYGERILIDTWMETIRIRFLDVVDRNNQIHYTIEITKEGELPEYFFLELQSFFDLTCMYLSSQHDKNRALLEKFLHTVQWVTSP